MDDKTLVGMCRSGDIDAFTGLLEKYNTMAVRTAYLITGRRDIAEDIAQEAFVQCYYSLKKLKDAERFKSWFYKILVRTGWKMAGKPGKSFGSDISIDRIIGDIPDDHDFTEDIEMKHTYEAVCEAVLELSKPLRTTAILFYFNGFSIKETAGILGCREGTVKSRLHGARMNVSNRLKQKGWDDLRLFGGHTGKEDGLNAGAGAN